MSQGISIVHYHDILAPSFVIPASPVERTCKVVRTDDLLVAVAEQIVAL